MTLFRRAEFLQGEVTYTYEYRAVEIDSFDEAVFYPPR